MLTGTARNLGLATLLLALAAPAKAEWITSWAAAPQPPTAAAGPFPGTPSFNNRTIRQTLRLSAGGKAVRIRLTNAFGAASLAIGGARIALLDDQGNERPGSSHVLSFAGTAKATAARGAPLLSDPVALDVPALAKLSLSLYLPGDTGPCTCHMAGLENGDVSAAGDFSGKPFKAESQIEVRAFVAAVEVDAPDGSGTIAVLGDSISDGVGSTPGANKRWPDLLAERLAARGGRVWGIANQGISGNRVLNLGIGESALARFDRDILSLPGVKAMILFEGVNDLGIAYGNLPEGQMAAMSSLFQGREADPAGIIAGYRQIIARAHAKGIKVIGATIAPYKGAIYWSEQGDAARQEVNRFIHTGGAFDGVLDFDAAFRDPADPAAMRNGYHMGDFLHGSDAGYKAVADSIDLGLFD